MRFALVLILLPQGAWAHAGHIADAAGHDHWVLGAALGAAAAAALWGWLKGQDAEDEADEAAEDAPEAA